MAIARSSARLKAEMNSGTKIGTMAFARFMKFPVSKSAPLACCARMILSVSSISIGMNLSAMDIIMAISCTGTLIYFKKDNPFSSPSVRLFGVVVRVIRDEPMIKYTSLITIKMAVFRPLSVMVIFHTLKITVPGVKNRLNAALISIKIRIAFRPLTMNLKGTFEAIIRPARARVATMYTKMFMPRNRDMIKISVPMSFTLGSRLCITEFV